MTKLNKMLALPAVALMIGAATVLPASAQYSYYTTSYPSVYDSYDNYGYYPNVVNYTTSYPAVVGPTYVDTPSYYGGRRSVIGGTLGGAAVGALGGLAAGAIFDRRHLGRDVGIGTGVGAGFGLLNGLFGGY